MADVALSFMPDIDLAVILMKGVMGERTVKALPFALPMAMVLLPFVAVPAIATVTGLFGKSLLGNFKARRQEMVANWIQSFPRAQLVIVTDREELSVTRDGFRNGDFGPGSEILLTGQFGQSIAATYRAFYQKKAREIRANWAFGADTTDAVAGLAEGNPVGVISLLMRAYGEDQAHDSIEKEMMTYAMSDTVREFLRNGVDIIDNDGEAVRVSWGVIPVKGG